MTDVVDWRQESAAEIVAEALSRLSGGQILQLPTESGPVLAALATPDSIPRLRAEKESLVIALPHPFAVFDWLPHLRGTGKRLIERHWPGPLTLALPGYEAGAFAQLPAELQERLLEGSLLRLRLPDHEWVGALVPRLPGPLMLVNHIRSNCDWIVRDEPSRFALPATEVRIAARRAEVLSEGAISAAEIHDASIARVLFVCTGNTCRSPMTAALCRKLLADHFGCAPGDLAAHGIEIQSAGLAAALGGAASPEAVHVVAQWGAELGGHASQPVTEQLVTRADRIYTMTLAHERWLHAALPGLPVETLAANRDIADPIGGDEAVYRACAEQIRAELTMRLPEILEL